MKKQVPGIIRMALLLGSCILTNCAPKEDDVRTSQAEVDLFHKRWNNEYFSAVYNDAHPDFRAVRPSQTTIGVLQHNRRYYGNFKSAKQQNVNIGSERSAKAITFTYESTYEHGKATEVFTFWMTNGKPLLARYHMTPETADGAKPNRNR